MKRNVIWLILVAALVLFASCTPKSEEVTKIRIGYTVNNLDKWTSYVVDEVRVWAAAHPDVEVVIGDSQLDEGRQMQQVEDWVSLKFNAICVKPVAIDSTAAMRAMAQDAGIPYIAVQQPVPGADGWVGADSYATGLAQADRVASLLGEQGTVVYISGDLKTVNAQNRERGVVDGLQKYPNMRLVGNETSPGWERSVAMTITENWIQAGIQFDAVIGACDEIVIGAIIAMDNAGLRGKITAGIDGTPDAYQYILDGKLTFTLYDPPSIISHKCLDIALDLANGRTVTDYPYNLDIVDLSNVQDYINL